MGVARPLKTTALLGEEEAKLRERVEALSGWGGEEICPLSSRAIGRAAEWICSLRREAIDASKPWIDPLITASEEGEVLFDWWRGNKRLTVYVQADGATYSRLWGAPPSF